MKGYITNANFSKIVKDNVLKDSVSTYEYKKQVLIFLSPPYLKWLKKYSIFLEELEKGNIPFFTPIKKDQDTFTKIFESCNRSYHTNIECFRLSSNYKNYEIPLVLLKNLKKDFENWINTISDYSNFYNDFYKKFNIELPKEMKDKLNIELPKEMKDKLNEVLIDFLWKATAVKFRKWFNDNRNLLNNNEKTFFDKMKTDWGVLNFENEWYIDNSGYIEIQNYTELELEKLIDEKIIDRYKYLKNISKPEQKIIDFLGKYSYNFIQINIEKNESDFINKIDEFNQKNHLPRDLSNLFKNYTYKEIYDLLKNYNNNYIQPLKDLLKQYITIKINPDFSFEKSLLENLGFSKCGECDKKLVLDNLGK